tara:strand:+ start:104 stop:208 length:105 start_codon:yes stop_codon:yes gene_type:complete
MSGYLSGVRSLSAYVGHLVTSDVDMAYVVARLDE